MGILHNLGYILSEVLRNFLGNTLMGGGALPKQ